MFTQGIVIHETYRSENGDWLLPTEVRIEGEGAEPQGDVRSRPAGRSRSARSRRCRSRARTWSTPTTSSTTTVPTRRGCSSFPTARPIATSSGPRPGSRVRAARCSASRGWSTRWRNAPAPAQREAGRLRARGQALRRVAHKALNNVAQNIEGLRYNVAVAQLYELTNALSAALDKSGEGLEWAIREAAELLVQMIGPMLPHLGEDCWERLGYNTLLADQPWPQPEAALLVDDTITIAVQVNGKRRDELTIARTATKDEIEAAALGLETGRTRIGRPAGEEGDRGAAEDRECRRLRLARAQTLSRRGLLRGLSLLLAAAPALAACGNGGFRPLYGDDRLRGGRCRSAWRRSISRPIPGRVGQRIRNELVFDSTGGGNPLPAHASARGGRSRNR